MRSEHVRFPHLVDLALAHGLLELALEVRGGASELAGVMAEAPTNRCRTRPASLALANPESLATIAQNPGYAFETRISALATLWTGFFIATNQYCISLQKPILIDQTWAQFNDEFHPDQQAIDKVAALPNGS